jgi:hypothetical protein
MLCLLFNPEDGGDMFFWNVRQHSTDYTELSSQKIKMVHYHVYNSPSLVPILNQMNPVHTFSSWDPFISALASYITKENLKKKWKERFTYTFRGCTIKVITLHIVCLNVISFCCRICFKFTWNKWIEVTKYGLRFSWQCEFKQSYTRVYWKVPGLGQKEMLA